MIWESMITEIKKRGRAAADSASHIIKQIQEVLWLVVIRDRWQIQVAERHRN